MDAGETEEGVENMVTEIITSLCKALSIRTAAMVEKQQGENRNNLGQKKKKTI